MVVISSQKITLSRRKPLDRAGTVTRVGPIWPVENTGTTIKSSRMLFRIFSETTTAGRG